MSRWAALHTRHGSSLQGHKVGRWSLWKHGLRELVEVARGAALDAKAEQRKSSTKDLRGIPIGEDPRPSSTCERCFLRLMVQL